MIAREARRRRPRNASFTRAAAGLAAAVACGGAPTQTYAGLPRPPGEVARLQDATDAGILEIDRERVSGGSWTLLPGTHEVLVRFRIHTDAPNMNWAIWTYCWVVLPADAGKSYTSVVRVRKEIIGPSISDKVTMEIGIADAQGVLQGLPRSCVPTRPKLEK